MSIPDFALGETIDFKFTTRAFATGVPTTLAGTPVIEVYEDNSTTQITAGETLTVDFDTVTGLNNLRIVATSGNGYGSGQSYAAIISTGTVGGVSVVGEVVAQFTIDRQALRPTTAGNTLDVTATGAAGIDWANVENPTTALDLSGTDIQLVDTATTVTNGVTLAGTATSAQLVDDVWDEVLTGGTHNVSNSSGRRLRQLQEAGGYSGAIWVDTVNGTAGTTDFENGTDTNPVDSIADADTLAASLGISRFQIAPGSSITLAATQSNQMFSGESWTLALGGQNIAGSHFKGATVSGTGTGASPIFEDCIVNAVTLNGAVMRRSFLASTITSGAAADWFLNFCVSRVAGTGTPSFDFGGALANTNLNLRSYSGGIELLNMGGAGTDNASVEGNGQVVLNANCSGGTLAIRGNFTVTDNAGGAVTLSDDARYDVTQVENTVWDSLTASHLADGTYGELLSPVRRDTAQAGAATTITLDTGASTTDDFYNGTIVRITQGTGAGQQRFITDYVGSTRVATVGITWVVTPDNTSEFIVLPAATLT